MIEAEYGTPEFKREWMEIWGHVEGTTEGDSAWAAKCAMMEGRQIRDFPMIFVRADVNYQSPVDGRVIRSQQQRIDDLKRNDCIEYDPEMKTDYMRRQQEADRALDASVEESVERQFLKMPSAQQERLTNELASGMDAEIVRMAGNGG